MYCAHLAGILCMVYRNDILFLTILIFSCYSIFMWSIFVNVDQDSFLISLFIALSSVVSMECSKGRWHTFFDILAHHPLPMPGFAADLASALGLNLPGLGLTVTPGGRPACVLSTHQGIYLEVCRGHLWRDPGESGFSVGGVLSRLGLCFGTSAGASLCSAWWRHPLGGCHGAPAHAHCGIRDSGSPVLFGNMCGSPEPGGLGGPGHTPKAMGHWVIQSRGYKDIKAHFSYNIENQLYFN